MADEVRGPGLSRRAVVRGAAWSVPLIVLAVAAPAAAASGIGAITFTPSSYLNATGEGSTLMAGTVSVDSGDLPTTLAMTYSAGFGGPATVPVGLDGTFTVSVTAPAQVDTGTVTASATGFTSGVATLSVTEPVERHGERHWVPDFYNAVDGSSGAYNFGPLTGVVTVTGGQFPSQMLIHFDPTLISSPASVPVDPLTGTFTVTGVVGLFTAGNFAFIYCDPDGPPGVGYLGNNTAQLHPPV